MTGKLKSITGRKKKSVKKFCNLMLIVLLYKKRRHFEGVFFFLSNLFIFALIALRIFHGVYYK